MRQILAALRLPGLIALATLASAAAAGGGIFQEEKIQAAFESLSAENVRAWGDKAQAGDPLAQNLMGLAHKYGTFVRQDHVLSVQWFRKAAEQGFADAQFNLGRVYGPPDGLYRKNRAAPEDYAEAAKWFCKAAEQGYVPAQIKLGELYASGGHGLDQDYVRAYFWTGLAAAKDNRDALKHLENYATHMSEADIADAKELAMEWKPKP